MLVKAENRKNILYFSCLIFLCCYFMQLFNISNMISVVIGGTLCLLLAIRQKKIRLDVQTILLVITLIIYFSNDMGWKQTLFSPYSYVAIVIYVLADYLGHEVKSNDNSEKRLSIIMLIVVASITVHGVLNSIEFFIRYFAGEYPRIWKDFWWREIVYGTMQVAYFLPAFAIMFPAVFFWKRKKLIYSFEILAAVLFLFVTVLSQTRMPVLILPIVFGIQFGIYGICEREKFHSIFTKKRILLLTSAFFVAGAAIVYILLKTSAGNAFLSAMSRDGGIFNNIRFKVHRRALEQIFIYPWGGNFMDHLEQAHAHNAWLDIADIGGVIPFFAFVIYTVYTVIDLTRLMFYKNVVIETKFIFLGIFIVYFIFFTIEPSLDWNVHFMTPWVFLHGIVRGYVKDCKIQIKKSKRRVPFF